VKRLAVFLFISALFAGTVFAQSRENRTDRNDRKSDVTKVTIEGVLKLEKGIVSVASGDSTYYVPMLTRYIGFIDGLKEGAQVSVEGSQIKDIIRPLKVTIGGKSYDFPEYGKRDIDNRFSQRPEDFRQPRNLSGRGRQSGPYGSCCR